MVVPSAAELNAAIKEFNEGLNPKDKIPLTFFAVKDEAYENTAFISRYSKNAELPLAEKGFFQIHDISYHIASLLFPGTIIDHTRRQYGVIEEFLRYLKTEKAVLHSKLQKNRKFGRSLTLLATHLDTNGNIHLDIPDKSKPSYTFRFFYNEGSDPQRVFNYFTDGIIKQFNESLFQSTLERDFISAVVEFRARKTTDPQFLQYGLDSTSYRNLIDRRVAFIKARINELQFSKALKAELK